MPSAHGAHIKYAWQHQVDAVISIVPPISGLLYPVLAATEDVRIIGVSAVVAWTVQPTPLEVVIVIDGQTITHVQANPVSGTPYQAALIDIFNAPAAQNFSGTWTTQQAFVYEGQNVSISARTTGGTVQSLDVRVKWARLLPT